MLFFEKAVFPFSRGKNCISQGVENQALTGALFVYPPVLSLHEKNLVLDVKLTMIPMEVTLTSSLIALKRDSAFLVPVTPSQRCEAATSVEPLAGEHLRPVVSQQPCSDCIMFGSASLSPWDSWCQPVVQS